MSSLKRAKAHFSTRRLDPKEFVIGHLSDETARLYAKDLFLIGRVEESYILSGNDKSRYTAILKKQSGHACEVFFDLPVESEKKEEQTITDARGRKKTTQISY